MYILQNGYWKEILKHFTILVTFLFRSVISSFTSFLTLDTKCLFPLIINLPIVSYPILCPVTSRLYSNANATGGLLPIPHNARASSPTCCCFSLKFFAGAAGAQRMPWAVSWQDPHPCLACSCWSLFKSNRRLVRGSSVNCKCGFTLDV